MVSDDPKGLVWPTIKAMKRKTRPINGVGIGLKGLDETPEIR